jgi:hypothetical protein
MCQKGSLNRWLEWPGDGKLCLALSCLVLLSRLQADSTITTSFMVWLRAGPRLAVSAVVAVAHVALHGPATHHNPRPQWAHHRTHHLAGTGRPITAISRRPHDHGVGGNKQYDEVLYMWIECRTQAEGRLTGPTFHGYILSFSHVLHTTLCCEQDWRPLEFCLHSFWM